MPAGQEQLSYTGVDPAASRAERNAMLRELGLLLAAIGICFAVLALAYLATQWWLISAWS